MKRVFTVCAIVALLLFATTLVTERASAVPQGKVLICHLGDDGLYHTIQVAAAAQQAHLNHGDCLGACEEVTCPIEE
jgi:hypothetical protein